MEKKQREDILHDLDLVEILEQIHEGFAICNADGKMLYITENMEKMFHTEAENVIGKVNDEIGIVKPAVSDRVIVEKRKISTRQENRFGEEFFITGVPIFDSKQQLKYVVTYNSWEASNDLELEENYHRLQQNNTRILNEINLLNNARKFDY
ncbi:MAG: PAS domain-containing protein [Lachnospiraceae bacterium]|nr:PAS domain-containing protein [Lachnospiraceae bacterium]